MLRIFESVGISNLNFRPSSRVRGNTSLILRLGYNSEVEVSKVYERKPPLQALHHSFFRERVGELGENRV